MRTRTSLGLTVAAFLLIGTASAVAWDTYKIDPAHTSLTFSVRHMGISNVKGHFDEYAGSIVMDGSAIKEAECTIQVKSINTGVKQRDDHLRTPDFFDAARFPTITFKTRGVEKKDDQVVLVADLTMRDVKKEVRIPITLSGPVKDPERGMCIGLVGKLTLNRKDYGINYSAALETGVAVVGEEISIEINIEATQQKE